MTTSDRQHRNCTTEAAALAAARKNNETARRKLRAVPCKCGRWRCEGITPKEQGR